LNFGGAMKIVHDFGNDGDDVFPNDIDIGGIDDLEVSVNSKDTPMRMSN
jgi:hypothetical protein